MIKPKKVKGRYVFSDHLDFQPNLSPRDIFKLGSFGGTYWRPIYSSVLKKNLKNKHLNYPKSWWKDIPDDHLVRHWDQYDTSINKYHKKVGTTLEFWEAKGWITKHHPYGWVQWYCNFFLGKRSSDDQRQISRWSGIAGNNGRFRKWLVTQIIKKNGKYDDESISPAIRQTLQHWGYKLTKGDFNKEIKLRQKK